MINLYYDSKLVTKSNSQPNLINTIFVFLLFIFLLSATAFTDKDCLRIWKGLFYSMWMSDKPLPQENLANKIASLLHSFDRVETSLQFYAMFLKTMAMEWAGIDQWRIDKFMMLVRKVTREMLRIVQSNDWDDNIIEQLSKRLSETVLTAGTPRGLFMHLTELYFEEVGKVTNGDIDTETVTKLLKPFMYYIASHSDYKLIQFVVRHVFNYLLFQSEAGREYKEKYDAWKTVCTKLFDLNFDLIFYFIKCILCFCFLRWVFLVIPSMILFWMSLKMTMMKRIMVKNKFYV